MERTIAEETGFHGGEPYPDDLREMSQMRKKEEQEETSMEFELRPWRMEDAETIARYANNPKIAANLRDAFPPLYPAGCGNVYPKLPDADPARCCSARSR